MDVDPVTNPHPALRATFSRGEKEGQPLWATENLPASGGKTDITLWDEGSWKSRALV